MSDTQPDPTWWLASDGRWYPPEQHPEAATKAAAASTAPVEHGVAGTGPAALSNRADRGKLAEERTAEALRGLSPDHVIFHGLRVGRRGGDVDHVVIGPTGVWIIDTKGWTGRVTVSNGDLFQNSELRTDKLVGVHDQAEYAGFVLGRPVNAVMCFVDTDLDRPSRMVGRVRVMTLDALIAHLAVQPNVLTPAEVAATTKRAEAWRAKPPERQRHPTATVASAPPPGSERGTRPSRPPQERRAPHSNRRTRVHPLLGLALGLIGAAFIYQSLREQFGIEAPDVGTPTSTSTTPTGAQVPDDLRVSVDCPTPGRGFVITARGTSSRTLRVSAAIGGLPRQYVGEVRSYGRLRPIEGIGPNQSIGFDVQYVNSAGQGEGSYHFDVATPSDPC